MASQFVLKMYDESAREWFWLAGTDIESVAITMARFYSSFGQVKLLDSKGKELNYEREAKDVPNRS